MLRPLEASEFDAYIEFAYGLSQDLTRSGYPTYCDGIKTRERFISRAKKSFDRPSEDILLFVEDGQAEGLIHFQHLEEDRYLQTFICNIRQNTQAALAEFVDYCRERWPGFDLTLGFPAENVEALSWLEEAGIPCIDRSWNYQIFLDGYTPLPEDPSVRKIGADNFEDFAAVHRKIEGMYWNCDRVRESLDNWAIFVIGEGDAAGEVLMTDRGGGYQEIFALEFADGQYREGAFRALLTAALNHLKARKTKYLTFFVQNSSECGHILTGLGFQLEGGYVCHRLTL